MVNLGCLYVCTFGNSLASVLVATHTVKNLDLSSENEGYEIDQISRLFCISCSQLSQKTILRYKILVSKNYCAQSLTADRQLSQLISLDSISVLVRAWYIIKFLLDFLY